MRSHGSDGDKHRAEIEISIFIILKRSLIFGMYSKKKTCPNLWPNDHLCAKMKNTNSVCLAIPRIAKESHRSPQNGTTTQLFFFSWGILTGREGLPLIFVFWLLILLFRLQVAEKKKRERQSLVGS